MRDFDAIRATANGDIEHARTLIRMMLGSLASDATIAIVLAAIYPLRNSEGVGQ